MARLLLGVSGGIAAYKALETARLAIRAGHAVRVIQTPVSERFVGRASFQGIPGAPVLSARGVAIITPGEGDLASHGERGIGRLAEPPELLAAVDRLLGPGTLRGVRVLVSAGGTREPVDSVRYIGNRSSGRMGYALAAEALRRGADVTLIAANLAVPAPAGVASVEVHTAAELERACEKEFDTADVLVMAAAVA